VAPAGPEWHGWIQDICFNLRKSALEYEILVKIKMTKIRRGKERRRERKEGEKRKNNRDFILNLHLRYVFFISL